MKPGTFTPFCGAAATGRGHPAAKEILPRHESSPWQPVNSTALSGDISRIFEMIWKRSVWKIQRLQVHLKGIFLSSLLLSDRLKENAGDGRGWDAKMDEFGIWRAIL